MALNKHLSHQNTGSENYLPSAHGTIPQKFSRESKPIIETQPKTWIAWQARLGQYLKGTPGKFG